MHGNRRRRDDRRRRHRRLIRIGHEAAVVAAIGHSVAVHVREHDRARDVGGQRPCVVLVDDARAENAALLEMHRLMRDEVHRERAGIQVDAARDVLRRVHVAGFRAVVDDRRLVDRHEALRNADGVDARGRRDCGERDRVGELHAELLVIPRLVDSMTPLVDGERSERDLNAGEREPPAVAVGHALRGCQLDPSAGDRRGLIDVVVAGHDLNDVQAAREVGHDRRREIRGGRRCRHRDESAERRGHEKSVCRVHRCAPRGVNGFAPHERLSTRPRPRGATSRRAAGNARPTGSSTAALRGRRCRPCTIPSGGCR